MSLGIDARGWLTEIHLDFGQFYLEGVFLYLERKFTMFLTDNKDNTVTRWKIQLEILLVN